MGDDWVPVPKAFDMVVVVGPAVSEYQAGSLPWVIGWLTYSLNP